MKVSFALFASFATLAVANPLPLKPDVKTLVGRADIVSVTCPAVNGNSQTTYSTRELEEAYSTAVSLLLPPPDKAKGKYGKEYPAYYGNFQNIALPGDCMTGDTYERNEFPILRTKVPFGEGSTPGPDRIVLARKNDGTFTYCYTIYHKNNGDFAQCT